jgi:hypothetical protein
MDKEKLKLIVRNLESLVECLKSEVYSDVDSYKLNYEEISPYIEMITTKYFMMETMMNTMRLILSL